MEVGVGGRLAETEPQLAEIRLRPGSRGGAALQHLDSLLADRLNHAAKLLDAGAEPRQLFVRDPVVLGVTSLHVSVLEFLEHGALAAGVCWPDVRQSAVEAFSLSAQKAQVV